MVGNGPQDEDVQGNVKQQRHHYESPFRQTAEQGGQLVAQVSSVKVLELNRKHLSYIKDEVIGIFVLMLELLNNFPQFGILLNHLNKFFHEG